MLAWEHTWSSWLRRIVTESLNVLEQHSDWNWDKVLNRERGRDWEVPKRDEICLLRVEIDVASDAVGIWVQCKEHLIVVTINCEVVSGHLWA